MSYALNALVLIRLDGRIGEWVSAADLASHIGLTVTDMQHVCDGLVQAGDIHHATHAGAHFYGVGVEGVPCAPEPLSSTQDL